MDQGSFEVEFADAPEDDIHPVSVTPLAAGDRSHWQKMFPPELPIEALPDAGGEHRPLRVRSTSADTVAAERIFSTVAAVQVGPNGDGDNVAAMVTQALQENPIEPEEQIPILERALPATASPEFHSRFAMLREHPTILRALGLIIDLRVPTAGLTLKKSGVVRVRWLAAPAGLPPIISPWTEFELDADRFLPKSTARVASGLIPLNQAAVGSPADAETPPWRVTTLNVDVAASRLREAATSILAGEVEATATLPALATGGISLLRVDRQQEMEAGRQARRQRGAPTAETIFNADDVTLGYRLDIRRGGADWQSLFLRQASYFNGDGTPLNESDQLEEGHLKPGSAVDYGDSVLRTDEMVARWSGWSLAVGRPTFDGGVDRLARARQADMPLHFEFQAPKGSLPRLRFASSYALRLRVADLAGGGLDVDDPAADRLFTRSITFRRFEPVGSPDVSLPADQLPDKLGPGESVFDIVLRSDRGMSAAAFATAMSATYKPALDRVMSQPQASLAFAEQHQMLDTQPSEASWQIIRDAVSDPDPSLRKPLPDPAAGAIAAFLPASKFGPEVQQIRNWPDWPNRAEKTLEVRDGSTGGAVSMTWSGEKLIVSPKQAQTMMIELSSPVRDDFLDHFSAKPFLGVSEDAAMSGRHPVLTPAHVIRITHAVRKPLLDPSGTFSVQRLPNQVYATLKPDVALIGANAPSTAKLEVTAAWTERNDDETHEIVDAPVELLTLAPDAEELPHDIRHEFGDTRHRRINYTVTAVSRFRHLFHAEEADDLFLAQGLISDINILSAARPSPLTLLNAYPAFRWTDLSEDAADTMIARRKREACIRVELQRPWFMTGEGEQIAVILPVARPPEATQDRFFSELGRDPVWGAASPDRWPSPEQFSLQTGAPAIINLPELGAEVIAVPHDVWFDRGRWFADIAIPQAASATYTPLARFALARFQRESLPGLSLSPVARTNFVPLLPDRTLTVSRTDTGFIVQLAGLPGIDPTEKLVHVALETSSQASASPGGATATGANMFSVWTQVSTASGALNEDIFIAGASGSSSARLRIREIAGGNFESGVIETGFDELSSQVRFADIITIK
jgi:hypothetical protein